MKKKNILTAIIAAFAALSAPAVAQDFPTKPVKLVIPFPAGAGANDIIGRYLAERLQEHWGKPVVVENRPGANSTIGPMEVIRSKADGHTILFSSANYAVTPAVTKINFDAAEDLAPVALVGSGMYLVFTGAHVEANSMPELIERSKITPVSFAAGTPAAKLQGALMSEATGMVIKNVPYGGTNEALVDLLGGRLDMIIGGVAGQVANIEAGKVKGLAVTGTERSDLLPDVPALREVGLQAAELPTWYAVWAPRGTPQDVIEKLNADIRAVLNTDQSREFLQKQSVKPSDLTSAETEAMVRSEVTKYIDVAKRNGIYPGQ